MKGKVRIEMTGAYRGKVWVDGVEQEDVVALSMDVDVRTDKPCRVLITKAIYPSELELDGEIDVTTLSSLAREYRFVQRSLDPDGQDQTRSAVERAGRRAMQRRGT